MADHFRERKKCLEILGLGPGASDEEIKKAYRAQALKFHPDKNRSEDATEKFQEIQYAYKYLQEGPSLLDHFYDDDDDDDDGIPLWILLRLFPWLFPTFQGHGHRFFSHGPPPGFTRRPGPATYRTHVYDPFGYDESSEDETYGYSFFTSGHGRGREPPERHAGRGGATGASASAYTEGTSSRQQTKRDKRKRAKERKKAEKAASSSAAKASAEGARRSESPADNFPTMSSSDWGKKHRTTTTTSNATKDTSAKTATASATATKTTAADSSASPSQTKSSPGQRGDVIKGDASAGKKSASEGQAKKSDDDASDSRSTTTEASLGTGPETSQPTGPTKKSKQQLREEQKRREEEQAKIAKKLEEQIRLDKERKAKKLAAQKEKERQEEERRKQEEEAEIEREAQRLREEQKRKEEEEARRIQEEEEKKEMARLLAEFDTDLFMDAKGDFLTRDTTGVGNIKKKPVDYTANGYMNEWEEAQMPGFQEQGSFRGGQGRGRGGRGRGQQGRGGFQTSPPFSGSDGSPNSFGSPEFSAQFPSQQPFGAGGSYPADERTSPGRSPYSPGRSNESHGRSQYSPGRSQESPGRPYNGPGPAPANYGAFGQANVGGFNENGRGGFNQANRGGYYNRGRGGSYRGQQTRFGPPGQGGFGRSGYGQAAQGHTRSPEHHGSASQRQYENAGVPGPGHHPSSFGTAEQHFSQSKAADSAGSFTGQPQTFTSQNQERGFDSGMNARNWNQDGKGGSNAEHGPQFSAQSGENRRSEPRNEHHPGNQRVNETRSAFPGSGMGQTGGGPTGPNAQPRPLLPFPPGLGIPMRPPGVQGAPMMGFGAFPRGPNPSAYAMPPSPQMNPTSPQGLGPHNRANFMPPPGFSAPHFAASQNPRHDPNLSFTPFGPTDSIPSPEPNRGPTHRPAFPPSAPNRSASSEKPGQQPRPSSTPFGLTDPLQSSQPNLGQQPRPAVPSSGAAKKPPSPQSTPSPQPPPSPLIPNLPPRPDSAPQAPNTSPPPSSSAPQNPNAQPRPNLVPPQPNFYSGPRSPSERANSEPPRFAGSVRSPPHIVPPRPPAQWTGGVSAPKSGIGLHSPGFVLRPSVPPFGKKDEQGGKKAAPEVPVNAPASGSGGGGGGGGGEYNSLDDIDD